MIEGRWTHMDLRCEIIDTERKGVVTLQPLDGLRYLIALTSRRRYLAQTRPLSAHQ